MPIYSLVNNINYKTFTGIAKVRGVATLCQSRMEIFIVAPSSKE
jgi:hypothetical protein